MLAITYRSSLGVIPWRESVFPPDMSPCSSGQQRSTMSVNGPSRVGFPWLSEAGSLRSVPANTSIRGRSALKVDVWLHPLAPRLTWYPEPHAKLGREVLRCAAAARPWVRVAYGACTVHSCMFHRERDACLHSGGQGSRPYTTEEPLIVPRIPSISHLLGILLDPLRYCLLCVCMRAR